MFLRNSLVSDHYLFWFFVLFARKAGRKHGGESGGKALRSSVPVAARLIEFMQPAEQSGDEIVEMHRANVLLITAVQKNAPVSKDTTKRKKIGGFCHLTWSELSWGPGRIAARADRMIRNHCLQWNHGMPWPGAQMRECLAWRKLFGKKRARCSGAGSAGSIPSIFEQDDKHMYGGHAIVAGASVPRWGLWDWPLPSKVTRPRRSRHALFFGDGAIY